MKSKKIFSVIGLILMVGTIIGSAIAYSSGFNYNNLIVIYGSNAAATDAVGAEDISNSVIEDIPVNVNVTIIPGNESMLIIAHGNDLNFGEKLNSIVTKIIDKDIPSLLASNSVEYQNGYEEDYSQVLRLGNNSINFGSLDSEDYVINKNSSNNELPIIYLNLDEGYLWELELKFDDSLDVTKLDDDSEIVIADKSYAFKPNMEKDDSTLVLYASGQKVTLNMDEAQESLIGGKTTSLEVIGANEKDNDDPDELLIKIDGVLKKIKEGNSLGINGDRIYLKNLYIKTVPEYDISAELFIGAEELELNVDSGFDTVKVNGDSLDGMTAQVITKNQSLDEIQKIQFRFTPTDLDNVTDEINYLEIGESITDPLFKTISFIFSTETEKLDSENRDYINFKSLGNQLKVTFTNIDGNKIVFVPYEVDNGNLTSTMVNGTAGFEEEIFITQVADDITEVFKIEDINSDEVEIYSYSNDNSKTYKVGDELEGDAGVIVTAINATNGKVIFNKNSSTILNTKNKMKITLSSNSIKFDESNMDKDESSIMPAVTNANIVLNGDEDIKIESITSNYTIQDSDEDGNYDYTITKGYATYFIREIDNGRELKVYVPAEEADFKIYLTNSLIIEQLVDENKSSLAISDIAANEETAVKDIIIVGGPCINEAAIKILGLESSLCGADFTAKTGVGVGQYLIKVFDNPFATGKKAILIAGYEAEDTTRGVKAFLEEDLDLTVGKQYIR